MHIILYDAHPNDGSPEGQSRVILLSGPSHYFGKKVFTAQARCPWEMWHDPNYRYTATGRIRVALGLNTWFSRTQDPPT
jgi:hypothetical protein